MGNAKKCQLCGLIFQLMDLVFFDKGSIMSFGRVVCSQEKYMYNSLI